MKSFKQILSERRSEEIKDAVETAKRMYQQSLTGSQMRKKNPEATAAFEKSKGATPRTIETPEGSIITNMPKGAKPTEEVISRLENKPQKPRKKTRVIKKQPITSTPESQKPEEPKKPKVTSSNRTQSWQGPERPSTKPAVTPAAATKPRVTSSTRTQSWQGPTKAPSSTLKPAAISRTQSVANTLKDVLKTEREAKSAQRAALASGAKKTLGNLGKTAGIIGAGLEAKTGYDAAKAAGASEKTAAGVAALKAAGALAGGALGGTLGGVLGVPGAIGGSVAGYTLGSKAGEAAAKAIRGDYTKKLTTKDVLSNVRRAVPYEIRKQVPSEVRKTYRDFVTQAGRLYGNWQKSQQGGNK